MGRIVQVEVRDRQLGTREHVSHYSTGPGAGFSLSPSELLVKGAKGSIVSAGAGARSEERIGLLVGKRCNKNLRNQ
jgi:hypothetical protein